jgi:lipid II:glycine glycyltransferase (peptidoglycan interpeptide bridge formation enzyme)
VHSVAWLEALRRTYGYQPVVYTTSCPGETLSNGVVLCRISSWLTGRRLVSLPFTDHCSPLVQTAEEASQLLCDLREIAGRENLKYIELRPKHPTELSQDRFEHHAIFRFHELALTRSLDELFRAAHKTSIQQAIRRAEREQLVYEEGQSETLLTEFYRLLLLTRRRHKLPPQPIEWFRNLVTQFGDRIKIRVARKDARTVASIITLHWGDTILYKYGCSDATLHNVGGMPFLLWTAVTDAKRVGARTLDFGRSDLDNTGLITFKDRWGATQSTLTYWRYSLRPVRNSGRRDLATLMGQVFARMPDDMLVAAGRALYRHVG